MALHHFCAVDLSAFYFDIRKDSLYCDPDASMRRRAVRTVLDTLFDCLTAWLAPFICFTAEEAWLTRYPDDESVHLRVFPTLPAAWQDDALAERIDANTRGAPRRHQGAGATTASYEGHRLFAGGGTHGIRERILPRSTRLPGR